MEGSEVLYQVVQLKHPECNLYQLLQVDELVGIEDKDVLPVAEAQDLNSVDILPVKMRVEVQSAYLRTEGEELAAGQLDCLSLKSEEKTALGIALVALKVTGVVEYIHYGSKNKSYLELFQVVASKRI